MGEDYLQRIYYKVIYSSVTSQHFNKNLQLNLKYRTQLVRINSIKNITGFYKNIFKKIPKRKT